ncbi:hypothetical protein [Hymenobacter volaticus]|uniref:DUF4760 domain-containing protein n=1 Tax=Hymenobacter volaticus TaxID=2932254 RepID=A0ABY4G1R2_9BACT|nr:hypothetical protein [Hymenobacter volaticus]UOQ64802.1 hypothetical protein MUN86_14650 [Hymenobacter volaticus]
MEDQVKNLWEIVLNVCTLIGAGAAFCFSLYTWNKGNHAKRAEFLDTLLKEFNNNNTYMARRLLDGFALTAPSHEQIILSNNLLRDHRAKPVISSIEIEARESFDKFLEFFAKVEFYFDLGLITKNELRYFNYYLVKCAYEGEGCVLNYAVIYEYDALQRLLYVMNINISNKNNKYDWKIIFIDNKQKNRYERLRGGY